MTQGYSLVPQQCGMAAPTNKLTAGKCYESHLYDSVCLADDIVVPQQCGMAAPTNQPTNQLTVGNCYESHLYVQCVLG